MDISIDDAKMLYEIKQKFGIDPLDYKEFDDYFNAVMEAIEKQKKEMLDNGKDYFRRE